MRLFYTLTLILGIMMAFVMPLVTIALPSDAFIASTLSHFPEQWSIQMDDSIAARLSHHEVKAEVVTALDKRASFRDDIYKQGLCGGLALMGLSLIGLTREQKMKKLKKVEPTTE